ncbi:MAG: chemotaxis response regulator protein-glutamate methylesterase [Dehalococcoidia bacterium]|nr:chemotaxis response regulator protein-glutamate methylesterase [Dehalococcoidia bacterium]
MDVPGKRIRVLIVDDSAFARLMISKHLSSDPEIAIAGVARDGVDAIKKIKSLKPDVITLDVEMPRIDGITALERIMSDCPTPVVMLSNLTAEGADVTIRALEFGAIDFFLKPSLLNLTGADNSSDELITKVKQASRIDVARVTSRLLRISQGLQRSKAKKNQEPKPKRSKLNHVVIIGTSTGGPRALYEVVPNIAADIDAAFLIVQHMPPKFTKSIADRLNDLSQIRVKEAEASDVVANGQALVAPGGFHMVVNHSGQIVLNQDRPRCGLRPAADVTMEAAAKACGAKCLGVILTGMGSDGTQGAAMIKAGGGLILAEHESTCVVYGMPRSVAEAGLVDKVVPLNRIVNEIGEVCSKSTTSLVNI